MVEKKCDCNSICDLVIEMRNYFTDFYLPKFTFQIDISSSGRAQIELFANRVQNRMSALVVRKWLIDSIMK